MAHPIRLVIDANIARAAGGADAKYPASVHCRQFLLKISDLDFAVVSTPALREEWERHQSRFFRRWYVSMVSAKRTVETRALIKRALRRRLRECADDEGVGNAMIKDCHLLEAALHSDRRVASCETRVRRYFASACDTMEEIRAVLWVNPADESEGVIAWLEAGAPEDDSRRLENYLKARDTQL